MGAAKVESVQYIEHMYVSCMQYASQVANLLFETLHICIVRLGVLRRFLMHIYVVIYIRLIQLIVGDEW